MSVALPSDWTTADPTATTDPSALASLSPNQLKSATWSNKAAEAGEIHFASYGKVVAPLGALDGGYVQVLIESGDASMQAFANRSVALDKDIGELSTSVDTSNVVLPAGVAVRNAYCGKIDAWPKYCEIDYLFRLPDGRSMTISISGSDTSADLASLGAFALQVIDTLKPAS